MTFKKITKDKPIFDLSVPQKNKALKVKRILVLVITILFAVGTIVLARYYGYISFKKNPDLQTQKEITALISEIGKFMVLPNDETPTIATIVDKEKLKDQPFFKSAENGDKLLVYTKAMKAILYRPSINKIIEVMPLSMGQQEIDNQIKVAYYNGAGIIGSASVAEKKIKEKYPNYQTVSLANAKKNNYKTTIVINLSGKYDREAENIAKILGAEIGAFPDGEIRPDADILVIVGKS